ncbi:uncharacterized protein DNG_05702 [Cephalotrichum gorgonifer]|uniref:Core domain-containing protein n=1 Tax=Cephalotrichum gorgonifer TaxID=2041049 RepID=A0AAE8MYB6_9PEZI|nr:uncharacterized protein DNG_05702 [Cephalotrichum gorgonifer]
MAMRAARRCGGTFRTTHDTLPLSLRSFSSDAIPKPSVSSIGTVRRKGAQTRHHPPQPIQRFTFATTTPLQKTIYLTEPRLDDDGKEMRIEITPRAAKRLTEIIKTSNDPSFALRVQVQSGGCHGFQYNTTNASIKSLSDLEEDESVFYFAEDDALVGADNAAKEELLRGPKVVLDEPSLIAVQGSKVDYTQELIGSKFEVVDNPLAENSCGCGSSFSLKL